jgi:hypothetical protein
MSYDLSKCAIDFTKCPKGTPLLDFFPQLTAFEEFRDCKDDVYIKIASASSDPDSPFVRIKDRELMLNSLFEFIEIPLKTEKDKKFFHEVLIYENDDVLECLSAYLRFCHDIDWTEYQTTKQTYDVLVVESHRKRNSDENIDDYVDRRVKVQNHLKKIGTDLKNLEAKIFPDSRAARAINLMKSRRIITYAEKYAESNTYI